MFHIGNGYHFDFYVDTWNSSCHTHANPTEGPVGLTYLQGITCIMCPFSLEKFWVVPNIQVKTA